MAIVFKNTNFAVSTLEYDLDPRAEPNMIFLTEATGFAQDGDSKAVIWSGSKASPLDDAEREIVELRPLGIPGMENIFNCYGGKEGTLMRDWKAGSKIAHVITAGKIDELEAEINKKPNTEVVEKAGAVVMKTANYSMSGAERGVLINAGVSDVKISLPDPALCAGRIFVIKRLDSGSAEVKISSNGLGLIDSQSSDILLSTLWERVLLISDGNDWYTI